MSGDKIIITNSKKRKGSPSEIKIDKFGNVYLDGKLYDENNTKYKNLYINVEKHRKVETGEETQKMIEKSKEAQKGETVVITDITTANKTQKTTVKF